jgi:predicted house-cleaning noncanonical NTP pyrophosphatase (MazG superfamily)
MSQVSRIYYNKLIRDNIPDIIKSKHQECEVRTLTDIQEFQQELFKKIKEEATSLSMVRTRDDFMNEYADLMMVLDTIIEQLEITPEELQKVREENLLRKGKYKHQHYLIWSADVGYESNESPQGVPL